MSALKAMGLRFGAVAALLLASSASHSALYLHAPSQWVRSEPVVFEVRAESDTLVNTYQFFTEYGALSDVLELTNIPVLTLPDILVPIASCNRFDDFGGSLGDACTLSSSPGRMVPQDTVLTRWEFVVKDDAQIGPVTFRFVRFSTGPEESDQFPLNDFDVNDPSIFTVEADIESVSGNEFIYWPEETKQFEVVAIPESSTWILMLAGLAVVGTRAYRVRMAAARG